MALVVKRSPTITGGTDATYTLEGLTANGKTRYIGPENTFLTPEVLLIGTTVSNPSKDSFGQAHSSHQLVFGDKTTAEGCCTVQANQISGNLTVTQSLGLASAKATAWLVDFRAYINSSAFETVVTQGNRPG